MREVRVLEPFHRHYERWAVRIGLLGNSLFVLGSVLFLFGSGWVPKACWLLGSTGMLVRAIGRMYADGREQHEHADGPRTAIAAARRDLTTSPE